MTVRAFYDVPAPAKLNLFLHVIGRRDDGYHLLQSLFVLIDWRDSLHFELRDDGQLHRHDLTAGLPADDLCLRAARALQAASGCTLGADISIDKQVPWGAGMGGGSSDAASTLFALNRLWRLDWPRSRLLEIGLRLGADVPFFLGGRNAFVEGIGERLTAVDVPEQWLAVLKPPVAIETRAIFSSPLLMRSSDAAILAGLSADVSRAVQNLIQAGRNDLQAAAQAECTEVSEAATLLKERYGNSRMTGSGSAVFAMAGTISSAGSGTTWSTARSTDGPSVVPMPENPASGWVGRMCRSLKVHPLVEWAEG